MLLVVTLGEGNNCDHAARGITDRNNKMKTSILLIAACVFCLGTSAKGSRSGGGRSGGGHVNSSSHTVSGHTTKNGTYAAPSNATNPNSTKTDNYSEKGNVNPYTGKEGTK